MRTLELSLCEEAQRDCASDPGGFATWREAYTALWQHDAHGCPRYLAAHAYVSDSDSLDD
ncbi:hypothetical protein [Nocardia sp. NBC_01388]|uniref:hypothetical protein n=1 Tax=Nocardia sp. NBC_01388 TaxID=2903596 RepID=UPI003256901E